MLDAQCLCAALPFVPSRARVVLVPHAREWRQPSNTGRVALLSLRSAELAVWGRREAPLDLSLLLRDGHTHLVLHPGPDARPIAPVDGPVRLLVPDGSWRRAGRIARRLLALPGAIPVKVDVAPRAGLRRAPEPGKVHTAAAIAQALEALGDAAAAAAVRAAGDLMIRRTLEARGRAVSARSSRP